MEPGEGWVLGEKASHQPVYEGCVEGGRPVGPSGRLPEQQGRRVNLANSGVHLSELGFKNKIILV
jgi:hypothetical protein